MSKDIQYSRYFDWKEQAKYEATLDTAKKDGMHVYDNPEVANWDHWHIVISSKEMTKEEVVEFFKEETAVWGEK
jgi:hypothetical protein